MRSAGDVRIQARFASGLYRSQHDASDQIARVNNQLMVWQAKTPIAG